MTLALVAIPARDEERRIGPCLAAVADAARAAVAAGAVREVRVAVSAHRCRDDTARLARELLAAAPLDGWLVLEDERAGTVGAARDTVIRAALDRWPALGGSDAWLFSTDADSTPPEDWMMTLLAEIAARPGPPAGARGVVELVGWERSAAAQRRYDAIIAAGLRDDDHDHVYGANLAVRLDAYLAAGGFPDVPSGEDHALVAALRRRGEEVPGIARSIVPTSGRTRARAAAGLGALLARLSAGEEPGEPPAAHDDPAEPIADAARVDGDEPALAGRPEGALAGPSTPVSSPAAVDRARRLP